ncbi:hypothetical protein [Hydrogenophaga sp. Root209]|uniref:hypothetical protein n=1 Tax=Hydrogenophaga sp. Root209 TaxID=1736490 RepID=UPI000A43B092|nr:hypothetical protein [Hydrogenophaga sp. Root209]
MRAKFSVSRINVCAAVMLSALPMLSPSLADASPVCNTRGGYIANQPETPAIERSSDTTNVEGTEAISSRSMGARQLETIPIDLSRLDDLIKFNGRYTSKVPVLGVRIENYPTFDPTKHCNRVAINIVKPRIERVNTNVWRASVENGRFSIDFDDEAQRQGLIADRDPSNRFFWIFPSHFGKKTISQNPWALTKSYDEAFRKAPVGSVQRRWIAEAYLTLALRTYRMRQLVAAFPEGGTPTKQELHDLLKADLKVECKHNAVELPCVTADLIEMNEAAGEGNSLSSDAFRTGDALLQNSGISTGLRQLDFASSNDQAASIGPKVTKALFLSKRGYGYLRPIRTWEVDTLASWYAKTGYDVNRELSRPEAKHVLLRSHVAFIGSAVARWSKTIESMYPGWSEAERSFLTIVAIDLENVSGFRISTPRGAKSACEVLSKRSASPGRSNSSVASSQSKRVANAALLAKDRFGTLSNLSCIDRQ